MGMHIRESRELNDGLFLSINGIDRQNLSTRIFIGLD